METLTWDYILKYIILGDSAVGKSSLLIRLTDDRFAATEPTLGVEFGSRILEVESEDEGVKRVKVQCWDTAGTESFRSITRSYFRGAAGALLVYDVTRRESFDHVTSWLDDLRAYADENVSIILVANKLDLCQDSPTTEVSGDTPSPSVASSSKRRVTQAEGEAFARANGLLYVETSAKEGWGVVDAFERTAREVLKNVTKAELERREAAKGKVKFKKGQKNQKGGCC